MEVDTRVTSGKKVVIEDENLDSSFLDGLLMMIPVADADIYSTRSAD